MFRIIGAFLGWLIGRSFWSTVLGFFIGGFFDSSNRVRVRVNKRTTSRDEFIKTLLIFTSAVVKADNGKMVRAELDFVKTYLLRIIGPEKTQDALLVLRDILEKEFDINSVAQQFGGNASLQERLMMLQFLFELSATDGEVHESEMLTIRYIARGMGVSDRDFEALKSMFFAQQGNYGNRGYTSSSSTGYRYSHHIENDYKILEVAPSVSDEELKKAYRKQAMKHHPDKVNHLGDDIRKVAEERFAKLNEAYDRIKKYRGMN